MKGLEKKKYIVLLLLLLCPAVLGLFFAGSAPKVSRTQFFKDSICEAESVMSGTTNGSGTFFEINDSSYMDMTLQSSEPVSLTLESVPEMVVINLEAADRAISTEITLNGFLCSTTYYKYEDNYHNSMAFETDVNGSYSYTQDLTRPHLVFILPRPSTKFIPGDTSIGTWDAGSRTYTLSTDVNETIQIDEDNLILDGAGHTVTGGGTNYGVYLNGRTGVTLRNLNVEQFSYGIGLYNSMGNTVTNNNASSNSRYGIYLRNSNDNTLTGNTASDNHEGIFLRNSSGNTLTANVTSNNYSGIYLHQNCDDNTLTGNTASKNSHGIYLYNSANNTLMGNTTNSNNYYGIQLYSSSNNTLTDNTSNWNHNSGFYLYNSSANTLTDNTCSNNYPGIYFYYNCNNNTLTGNTALNNYFGIYLYHNCNNNEIYNNNFINNQTQAYTYSCSGNIFNLPAPTGGNYWSNWTAPDTDRNGLVDDPYVFTSGQDSLPWVRQYAWSNAPPVANAGADQQAHPIVAVTLDGSGSSDVEGDYPLTYSWQFSSKPEGSSAVLSDPAAVAPLFTVDMLGDYTIELIVTDSLGATSEPDYVLIGTYNTAPVANAGTDQSIILLGTTVELNGGLSHDADADGITYFWTITQKPAGSTAELSDPSAIAPNFVADIHGDYLISLVVTDVFGAVSAPDSVTVSFENIKPVADAGTEQSVMEGETVFLDGSGSSDSNGDLLSYSWSFTSVPPGSLSEFANPTSVQTSFTADKPGTYVVSLVVNDGFENSDAAEVTITATSYQEMAAGVLLEAIATVRNLPPEVLKNGNVTKDSIINKIEVVLDMIEDGRYENAAGKLINDVIERNDGCANSGEPDSDDWIITCEGQNQVYPLVIEALGYLQNLI